MKEKTMSRKDVQKRPQYRFAVITKAETEHSYEGNFYDAIVEPWQIRLDLLCRQDRYVRFPDVPLAVRLPVFEPGEILILEGDYEREVGSKGRKPSKWNVEYEVFDTVGEAVLKSKDVLNDLYSVKKG